MTKQDEFLKGLAAMLECDGQKVVPGAVLGEIGTWDSMSVMQAQVLIDEIYGFSPEARAIANCKTVSDVLALTVEK